jgi:hypothetical protein
MCPVHLFAEWWKLSDGSKGGYVFRKKIGSRFSVDPLDFMASNCYPGSVANSGSTFLFPALRIILGVLPQKSL